MFLLFMCERLSNALCSIDYGGHRPKGCHTIVIKCDYLLGLRAACAVIFFYYCHPMAFCVVLLVHSNLTDRQHPSHWANLGSSKGQVIQKDCSLYLLFVLCLYLFIFTLFMFTQTCLDYLVLA